MTDIIEKLALDPCPWHRDNKPTARVNLVGHRDDPIVKVRIECPVCGTGRNYFPTEREVQAHYENRYSANLKLIQHLAPKLAALWNWSHK